MHKDGFEKHVAVLSGCQVLYLDQDKIDKYTYNGSQLNRDMMISLANNNPDIKFFIISTCLGSRTSNEAIKITNSFGTKKVAETKEKVLQQNLEKIKSIFKYDNIEFVVENKFRFHGDDAITPNQLEYKMNKLLEYMKAQKIDYAIIKGGCFGGHVPFLAPKISKPLDDKGNTIFAGRSAVIEYNAIYTSHIVNNMDFPYITINDDDNFCGLRNGKKENKNIIHPEVLNINMYSGVNEYNLYKDLKPETIRDANEDKSKLVNYKVPVVFKEGMDCILLKSKTLRDINRDDIKLEGKNKNLFMYFNFREKNSVRYNRFMNFVLDNDLCVDKLIWSNLADFKKDDFTNGKFDKYGDIFFPNKGHKETMDELTKSKYTLCISVFEKQFCIGRFWEAIYCKCIPFVHREADENNELIFGIGSAEWVKTYSIPEILLVKNPQEMKERIKFLEENEDEYLKLMKQLDDLLKPEYSDINYINKMIMEEVNRLGL